MTKSETAHPRHAGATRRRILDAALGEFSTHGFDGARVDRVAASAEVSKPMIYSYFGDKDALYKAALKEAYVQIRAGEREIATEHMDPEEAIRKLVRFTMEHFVQKPWFITMLNTENLRKGETVREIENVVEIQSTLIAQLRNILERGAAAGQFRTGIDPAELYVMMASLCFFPVSNRHTLRVVFEVPIDAAWLTRQAEEAGEMLVRYLRIDPGSETPKQTN
ncbi:MAG: TetR family transcriptional regulator [Rhizobiaceae bacterium]|nr:TetR family transcriptional regulator [Rhizobiaceae bacterium]